MSELVIRPYLGKDRAAVRRISFETGLMGASVAPQYADLESWADVITSYYTDVEPEHAQVIARGDEILGYLLSAFDSRKCWSAARIALQHCALRGVCLRPGTARFYRRSAADMLADLTAVQRPRLDHARYPSHLHINLTPAARRGGTGTELVFRYYDQLAAAGVPGTHAEIMHLNTRTLSWAASTLGLLPHGEPYPLPGLRGPDGGRIKIQLVKRDLRSWVAGAWRSTG